MSETVYASDLCKLYIENEITDLKYLNELYNQIRNDLFEFDYINNHSIICSYSLTERSKPFEKITINIISFNRSCVDSKSISYSGLKTFTKCIDYGCSRYYYYDLRYGKINASFYESLMEKIELLNLNDN